MAKSLLSVKTKKKPKISRSEAYMVNFKYLGDEPDSTKFNGWVDYAKAFSWYNSMCSKEDAREYIKDYLLKHEGKEKAKLASKIPDAWIPLTQAWLCRIALRRDEKISDKDMSVIVESSRHGKSEEEEDKKPVVVRPTIQERIRDKVSDIIGDIEEMIDKGEDFSLYDWLQKKQVPPMHAAKIGDYYGPIWHEMVQAHAGKIEGYENWSKSQLKARVEFYNSIVSDAERYFNVAKKTRVIRKPRPVSVEKQLKGLKYQKDSAEYKLASVDPQKILGAQELWTFNTKYKTVTIFRALDRGGLKVKGTSITGFDEKLSASYKTGRKPEAIVDQVSKSTKAGLKKVLDPLKPHTFNPRINENTILLKVIS